MLVVKSCVELLCSSRINNVVAVPTTLRPVEDCKLPATLNNELATKSLTESSLHRCLVNLKTCSYMFLVARYEHSSETVHIFISRLSIRPEKQPERKSDVS